MKNYFLAFLLCHLGILSFSQTGKVGINTTTPQAMLHVKDSSVVFTGPATLPSTPGIPPVSGAGARMMWYPDQAAFRVGYLDSVIPYLSYWNYSFIGKYSFASGHNSKASGFASTAIGSGTQALSIHTTAFGYNTTASSFGSTAMGVSTTSSGANSTAMGAGTVASGFGSTAMGVETVASGDYSTSMGREVQASGNYSVSIGYSSIASGSFSFAKGSYSEAVGYNSTAMGASAKASGRNSTSIGTGTNAKSFSSVCIGQYNDSISTSSSTTWVGSDPALIIGNGASHNARSNAFIIAKNGETAINLANSMPAAALHIKGTSATFDAHLRLETADASTEYCNILYDGNTKFKNSGAGDEYQWLNAANNNIMRLRDNGDLNIEGAAGINIANADPAAALHIKGTSATFDAHLRLESAGANTDYCNLLYDGNTKFRNFGVGDEYQWRTAANVTIMRLQENGNLTINGLFTSSDKRLKEQIVPLKNSLEKITALGGYQYNWIDKARGTNLQTGLMAQEVQVQMPELVKADESGSLSVNYLGMIPYLVETIKEQQVFIKKQEESFKTQEQSIAALQQANEQLLQEIKSIKKVLAGK
jgi:hypothetical protein